jgi:hypothetical protein
MGGDYRNHLMVQIELLRGDISNEEFSERLGDITERCLARYIAGKSHLTKSEFKSAGEATHGVRSLHVGKARADRPLW